MQDFAEAGTRKNEEAPPAADIALALRRIENLPHVNYFTDLFLWDC
jgi:hypothetical protein